MKPVEFQEANRTLTKPKGMTDEECGPLPVHCDGAVCTSVWRVESLRERLRFLLSGEVSVHVHSGNTQPPIAIAVRQRKRRRR
jgi:hypothetical protein